MSNLDSALWKRINQIVYVEKRYFDYTDFVPTFKVDGRVYQITHGTFRNYMSLWKKKSKLEVKMYSPQALYTIKGVKFETSITGNHTGDILSLKRSRPYNDPIYRIIQNIPFGQRALHDYASSLK